VKYRIDGDSVFRDFVEYFEWKPANERSPEIVHHERKDFGMALDGKQAGLDTAEKVFAEAGLTVFTPAIGFHYVLVGFGEVDDCSIPGFLPVVVVRLAKHAPYSLRIGPTLFRA
jgi:hypothetical protein